MSHRVAIVDCLQVLESQPRGNFQPKWHFTLVIKTGLRDRRLHPETSFNKI